MRRMRNVSLGAIVLREPIATVFQLVSTVMVNFPGRNGRRRRVLNEEVLSASSALAARQSAMSKGSTENARRYSDAASVENHPQVTDFIPRKYRTIGMVVTAGAATAVMLGALHHFAQTVAAAVGMPTLRPFDIGAPGSIAAWVSAVVLFVASLKCLLIYSIRRHRIEDIRGRYRVWLGASAACMLLSVNCVAGLHQVVAHTLSHLAGWTALRDGAVWWIAIAGLPLAWIGVRVLLEVRECRLASTMMVASVICYATSAASYFGFIPTGDAKYASLITGSAVMLGHWIALAMTLAYARFIVLDAQGLINARRPALKKPKAKQGNAKADSESKETESKPTILSVVNKARERASQTDADEDAKRWVDGRRFERQSYNDDDDEEPAGGSKLSKSDRKRLRKLKAQNRAA
jgi:hypothetical protein